ncbi:GlxA family transcriptional regulator [Inquilinus sp.]|jgi:transcriptional regulator GlxA family with amidase domain|uniref:GlxA family transcriptional regulator n=1 Tax=Inquilinus sp. TaxID=1932117 RepID=UPI003783CF6B
MRHAAPNPAEAGIVIYPGSQPAMIHGLTDLLRIASDVALHRGGGPVLRISHWAPDAAGRMARRYDSHPGGDGDPGILILPGRLSGPVEAAEAAPFTPWLAGCHARGTLLAAVCGGAFLLAETGLLSGRPATTHWAYAEAFRDRFPDVRLAIGRMVVDDGDIVTGGGLMAWTDLGLRLAARIFGPEVAAEAARFLLIDSAGREQRHYGGFVPRLGHGDEAILKVQHWLQATGARVVTIAEMARRAGLGERTFLRRYKAATGMRPTEYAQHLRVEVARDLLRSTRRPVDQIAWTVGYEDAAAFRRLFHRLVGLSPGDYRRRFGAAAAAPGH